MGIRGKWVYITFMGALTTSALTACNWQTTKYFKAVQRWKVIAKQLNNDEATDLNEINKTVEPYPFKYIKVVGQLSSEHVLINRPKGERLGYLIMRTLRYSNGNQKEGKKEIIACDGWIPDNVAKGEDSKHLDLSATKKIEQFRGLLKKSQKLDYLHSSFDKETLRKSGMQTYVDIEEVNEQLKIQSDELNKEYYIEILKQTQDGTMYPIKYTKKDFQLPYLTPAKHRDYATFWAGASLVGIFAILKVLKM